ncbi:hypothetical protein [Streptomyces hokutonensis]|uniref:hypothetical protein n=1 Tax=Streptomyces hokutonensis TaxID=1306990 RepID=UPI000377B593
MNANSVLLTRAFAQHPDVLVLDEPTNHLDIRHQAGLLALASGGLCEVLTHALMAVAFDARTAVIDRPLTGDRP